MYLRIPVEEECSKLLCINIHRGLYEFGRLPFEVKVAPAIFQQLMNTQNVEQHKEHVHKVFSRIQEYSFKLKESKCHFFIKKIKYLGNIIDKDGRRSDPERITEIKDMPAPENVSSLQSFLRLANYYQVFLSNMHN